MFLLYIKKDTHPYVSLPTVNVFNELNLHECELFHFRRQLKIFIKRLNKSIKKVS